MRNKQEEKKSVNFCALDTDLCFKIRQSDLILLPSVLTFAWKGHPEFIFALCPTKLNVMISFPRH